MTITLLDERVDVFTVPNGSGSAEGGTDKQSVRLLDTTRREWAALVQDEASGKGVVTDPIFWKGNLNESDWIELFDACVAYKCDAGACLVCFTPTGKDWRVKV